VRTKKRSRQKGWKHYQLVAINFKKKKARLNVRPHISDPVFYIEWKIRFPATKRSSSSGGGGDDYGLLLEVKGSGGVTLG